MTDVYEMISQHPNPTGDRISREFTAEVVPQLADLTTDELWMLTGMLLYLDNDAEARVVAEYAITNIFPLQ